MNGIEMAKARATAALDELRPRIAGRPFYAWAGFWHGAGWTELVWAGEGWMEICTVPKRARMVEEIRLSVIIESTGERICESQLVWRDEEGPADATAEPCVRAGTRG